ncbi:reverse transcriptase family protein [Mesorhizobium sp. M0140]|uniref:reverse transcriptase family protein n=1 Tax=Mesorhizobium sp. M0140 TaxID=2956893 RepID=UPI003339675D
MMAFHHDFRRITNRESLMLALGIDASIFDAVLDFDPPAAPAPKPEASSGDGVVVLEIPMFIRHDIPKRNPVRGMRTVWEPTLAKSEYKALARRLESFFRLRLAEYPHLSAYGYRAGRNIKENAAAHSGHHRLLSVDVREFFPSISRLRIGQLFENLGVVPNVSELLSRFVTIGDVLPLGLPTSPTLSNAIALPIDTALTDMARRTGCTYTRYADDLSFSGNDQLPDIDDVRLVLSTHDFTLAEAKTRRSKVGQAHFVTGLSISDPNQPHVPREKKRRLRQELYFGAKFGLQDHFRRRGINDAKVVQQEINRLDGMVKFVAHHEPRMAPALKAGWSGIMRASGMKPSFAPRGRHRAPFYIFIDEAEFDAPYGRQLAIGMAVTQHGGQLVAEAGEVLESAAADLFLAGDHDALVKRGLHFADASEDLRLKYVTRLASMRFEGYVALGPLEGDSVRYESSYLRLLGALISRRLMAAESQFVFIYCEENSKVSRQVITDSVQSAFDDLKARNDRRPDAFGIEFVAKPNLGISAPDFLLGVLGRYLRSAPAPEGKPEPRDRLMFERLRDKYRLILDVSTWTEYSRRRPIEPWR